MTAAGGMKLDRNLASMAGNKSGNMSNTTRLVLKYE